MKRVIVIVGPTAIGKTKLSIELAKRLDSEVISGDSAQVYKRLDIGTAKVTKDEMDGIKHHLIDIKDPTEEFSVADFQFIVREKIDEISNQNMMPIICGGTGLYIRSVLYDYRFVDEGRDDSFKMKYENYTNDELHSLLASVDQESANKIHMNNRRRVLRAIEMYDRNEKKKSELQLNDEDKMLYDAYVIGLNVERDLLYERINKRVDQMIEMGLIEEVRNLYNEGIKVNIIGYKEFYEYFEGLISQEEAIEKLKKDTRNLAKRQLTFFRNKLNVNWFTVNLENFDETVEEVYRHVKKWLI